MLIGRTVVDSLTRAVDHCNHVSRIFGDELKELVALRQLPPGSLQLQVLIQRVNVEQQNDASQSADPFFEISPVTALGLGMQLEEG